MKLEKLIEELDYMSPFLSQLKKDLPQDGFEVPKQYFQHLTVDVMQKIEAENQVKQGVKPSMWQSFWAQSSNMLAPRAALGFTMICVLGMTYFLYPLAVNNNVAIVLAPQESVQKNGLETNITSEDATAYIEANIDDFDEKMILEAEVEPVSKRSKNKILNINNAEMNHLLNKIIEQEQLTDEELENLL
jgi:hypothetical protein